MHLLLDLVAVAIPLLTGTITTFFETKTGSKLNRWGWAIISINVLATLVAGATLIVARQDAATDARREAQLTAQKELLAHQEHQLEEQQHKLAAQADKAWQEFAARKISQVYVTFKYDGPADDPKEGLRLALLQYVFISNIAPEDGSAPTYHASVAFQPPGAGQSVEKIMATAALGAHKLVLGLAVARTEPLPGGRVRRSYSGSVSWAQLNMARVVPTVASLADLSVIKALSAPGDTSSINSCSVSFELADGHTVQCFLDPAAIKPDPQEEPTGFPFVKVSGQELLTALETVFRAKLDDPAALKWLMVTLPGKN